MINLFEQFLPILILRYGSTVNENMRAEPPYLFRSALREAAILVGIVVYAVDAVRVFNRGIEGNLGFAVVFLHLYGESVACYHYVFDRLEKFD